MERREYIIRILLTMVLIGLAYALILSRQLVIVSLIGIGIATVVNPPVLWLKNNWKIPRSIGAFLIFSLVFLIVIGIIFVLGKISTEQLSALSEDIPGYSAKLEKLLTVRIGPFGQLSELVEGIDFNKALSGTVEKITAILSGTMVGASGASISFVIAFFLCLSSKYYKKQIPLIINPENKEKIEKIMARMAGTLRAYFSALLIDMIAISLLTSFGLYLIGFKYWIVVGIMSGFFCLVPYVGVISVAIIACLMAIGTNVSQIPYILLVYIITQQLEGNLIFPYIMRKRVSLPEAPLLIFILLMAQLFGVLGAFIAAPIMAISLDIINFSRSDDAQVFKISAD